MYAVILAAGKGSRLGKETEKIPKPMIKIDGIPILEKNILICKESGITKIFINLFYLPHKIIDYFGDGSQYGVEIKYNLEEELLGTAGAILGFKKYIRHNAFFVIYGDNYTDFDLNLLKQFNEERKADMSILFHWSQDVSRSGVADLNKNSKLINFNEKPSDMEKRPGWVNAGIYYISNHEMTKRIQLFDDFSIDYIPKIINEKFRVYGLRSDIKLLAVDTPELLNDVTKT